MSQMGVMSNEPNEAYQDIQDTSSVDSSEGNIKVCIRLRPFNNRELANKSRRVVDFIDKNTVELHHPELHDKKWKFAYDKLYWSFDNSKEKCATQEHIFNDIGLKLVKHAFDGYNATLIAYGQTSSGKTHTIIGPNYSPTIPEAEWLKKEGLVPRICREVFHRVAILDKSRSVEEYFPDGTVNKDSNLSSPLSTLVYFRMMEIYKEKVKDLLNPHHKNIKVSITNDEGDKRNIFISAPMQVVTSFEEIDKLIEKGNKEKQVAETKMNERSSRSHTIFQIRIEQPAPGNKKRVSILNLVDLAGSENAKQAATSGDTLKEGAAINKSLSALGQVIDELVSAQNKKSRKSNFVSYRNSVLTSILANSLGGNAKTFMLCTISPSDFCFNATKSTLRYGQKTQKVRNKATVNEDSNVKLIRELRANIEMLKKQMVEGISSEDTENLRRQLEESKLVQQRLEMSNYEEKEKAQYALEEIKQQLSLAEEQCHHQQILIEELRCRKKINVRNAKVQTAIQTDHLVNIQEVIISNCIDDTVHSEIGSEDSSSSITESSENFSTEKGTESSNDTSSSFDEFEIEDEFESSVLMWRQEGIENGTDVPIDIDTGSFGIVSDSNSHDKCAREELLAKTIEPFNNTDSHDEQFYNGDLLHEEQPTTNIYAQDRNLLSTPVSDNDLHKDEGHVLQKDIDSLHLENIHISMKNDEENDEMNSSQSYDILQRNAEYSFSLLVRNLTLSLEFEQFKSLKNLQVIQATSLQEVLKLKEKAYVELQKQFEEKTRNFESMIQAMKAREQKHIEERKLLEMQLNNVIQSKQQMEIEMEENKTEAVTAMKELKEKFGISPKQLEVVKKKKKEKKACLIM